MTEGNKSDFESFVERAEAGSSLDMRKVGEFLAAGQIVEKNDESAAQWFLKAAEAGDAEANYILGTWYRDGRSFDRNYKEAAARFYKAYKDDHKKASLVVAEWAAAGHIFEQNVEAAARLYGKLTSNEDLADSANKLGIRFSQGAAFVRSKTVARKLYEFASTNGCPYATGNYARFVDDGEGGPRDPALAVELHQKAANMGNPHSKRMLAQFHDVGRRVEVDTDRAIALVGEAATEGSACAKYDLARAHHFGLISGVNLDQAIAHYEQAVDDGCSCAKRYLSRACYEKHGRPFKPKISTAFDADTSYCAHLLAGTFLFATGIDRDPDLNKAIQFASAFEHRQLRKCQHRLVAERFVELVVNDTRCLSVLNKHASFLDALKYDGIPGFIDTLAKDPNVNWSQIECFFSAYNLVCAEFGWVPLNYSAKQAATIAAAYAVDRPLHDIEAAQQNVGFMYNKLSDDGFLIPYRYDENAQPSAHKGIDRLRAIHFTSERKKAVSNVSLVGSMDTDTVPLLTDDDLTVALALAFSDQPQLPSLSLEKIEHDAIDGRTSPLRRKVFSPRWIGSTNFGRALYYADWLMCSGYGATVSLTQPFAWPNAKISRMNGAIYDPLVDAHFGQQADTGRVMLNLTHVDYTPEKHEGLLKNEEVWWVNGVRFQVDGAGTTYLEDGAEDRMVGLNDPDTPGALTGIIHTNRYESLCAAYPVFARVRELFTLMRMIMDMRKAGFSLAPSLAKRASSTRNAAMSKQTKNEEFIVNW